MPTNPPFLIPTALIPCHTFITMYMSRGLTWAPIKVLNGAK